MRKIFFYLTFFLLSPLSLLCQNFGTLGTIWHYGGNIAAPPEYSGYVRTESIKDTIVDGFFSQLLLTESYNYFGNQTGTERSIIRSSNDSVFFYSPARNQFSLIYKFDLSIGDTFQLDNPIGIIPPSYRLVVDSITTETFNGQSFKKFRTRDLDTVLIPEYDVFLEKIGRNHGLLPFVGPSIPEHSGPIRCFEDNNFSINFQSYPCDYLLSDPVIDLDRLNTTSIFPNPVLDRFFIKSDHPMDKFALLDSKGTVIIESNKLEINCTKYPSGFYLGLFYRLDGSIERIPILIQK